MVWSRHLLHYLMPAALGSVNHVETYTLHGCVYITYTCMCKHVGAGEGDGRFRH